MISLQPIIDNLKDDCCCQIFNRTGNFEKIKLYRTIKEACLQKGRFKEYDLKSIIDLNKEVSRPTGIVCRKCKSDDCVISLRIDEDENTRFCNCKNIELR